jgi:hypothetical protein
MKSIVAVGLYERENILKCSTAASKTDSLSPAYPASGRDFARDRRVQGEERHPSCFLEQKTGRFSAFPGHNRDSATLDRIAVPTISPVPLWAL